VTRLVTRLLMVCVVAATIGCGSGAAPVRSGLLDQGLPGMVPSPPAAVVPLPSPTDPPEPTSPPAGTPSPTHTAEPTAAAPATEPPTATAVLATATPVPTDVPPRTASTVAAPLEVVTTPTPVEMKDCPYIGNQTSGVFHHAGCSSVRQMAEHNKVCLQSRDEAIQRGFRPCQRCHP